MAILKPVVIECISKQTRLSLTHITHSNMKKGIIITIIVVVVAAIGGYYLFGNTGK